MTPGPPSCRGRSLAWPPCPLLPSWVSLTDTAPPSPPGAGCWHGARPRIGLLTGCIWILLVQGPSLVFPFFFNSVGLWSRELNLTEARLSPFIPKEWIPGEVFFLLWDPPLILLQLIIRNRHYIVNSKGEDTVTKDPPTPPFRCSVEQRSTSACAGLHSSEFTQPASYYMWKVCDRFGATACWGAPRSGRLCGLGRGRGTHCAFQSGPGLLQPS